MVPVFCFLWSNRPDADEFRPHIEASSSFVRMRKALEVRADREEYWLENEVGASTVVASCREGKKDVPFFLSHVKRLFVA